MNRFATFLASIILLWGSTSFADSDLPSPTGSVILTVSGAIENTNSGSNAEFDLEMLQTLPTVSFTTETVWTEGEQTFVGVELFDLMNTLGASGNTIRATALNDYAVEIPMTDAIQGGALLAYHMNGEEMSVRDKGPLWVMYPFDANSDYRNQVYYARSIWQLDRIEIVE